LSFFVVFTVDFVEGKILQPGETSTHIISIRGAKLKQEIRADRIMGLNAGMG